MLGKIGHFELLSELGAGGMGVVYRALDTHLQREVALKRLRSEFAASPAVLERFRNEAKLQGRLNHPNIAQLYSLEQTPDAFCLVMEFIRGAVVQELIPLSCDQAAAVMVQLLDGLECAHRLGVMHRDLKPENLLVDTSGTLKIMDFGIAYAIGSERMTREKSLIGTIEYMSPERILRRETTARSDIYALGIILFEMISGKLPFGSLSEYELLRWQLEQNAPPIAQQANVPALIDQVIARAMAKDPDHRYASCSEMAEDLSPLLRGQNPQTLLAPLVASRAESAKAFNRKQCFAEVRSEWMQGNTTSAERLLSVAVRRHPGEPGLRQYQSLLSRTVFELDQELSAPRCAAIRLLADAVTATKSEEPEASEQALTALRQQAQGTPLALLI